MIGHEKGVLAQTCSINSFHIRSWGVDYRRCTRVAKNYFPSFGYMVANTV